MNNKPYLLPLIFIITGILLLAGGYFLGQRGINIAGKKIVESPVSNILFLTPPVTEFTGKIDKISGNSIWISAKFAITPPPTPPNAPTVIPGSVITVQPLPPTKTFTYKVNIAAYTQISKPEAPVIYLIKKITPTPTPKLTIKDMRVGQIISVSAMNDLRTLKTEEFDAYSVKLSPIINTISGKITNINIKDGIIVLKAIPPVKVAQNEPTPEPKEIEYAIFVTDDTEISRMGPTPTPAKAGATPKPAQPLEYQISDLKTDIQITVYTDLDVIDNQKIKALRIEPPVDLLPAEASSPSAQATVSPKP